MNKKIALVSLLTFLVLMGVLQTVKAATITSATLDKDTYLAGQTGYVSVTIYNDKSEKIRVTELTATINYYYTDGTVYVQKFFTSATLPDEIQEGQTETYQIPISLPTNLASGYTNPLVEARTEIWQPQTEHWISSDRASSQLKLNIESPYKQSHETSQLELEEQMAANKNLSNTVTILAMTTLVFAAATAFLMFFAFAVRPRQIPQA